jgi:magnesium transporter
LITAFVHRNGQTQSADRVEPEWLDPSSSVMLWVDLAAPGDEERRVLLDVFRFHPLAVEDAGSALQFPKIEPYQGYLYLVLHGIDAKPRNQFATRDVDFFLGRNFLVTVHDGDSRSIERIRAMCDRHEHILREGPVALLHRIVDTMVDNYRPVIQELEDRVAKLEEQAFSGHERLARQIMKLKRDVSSMRRVMVPQRDAIARLARREFPMISDEMAYRFRDVYDHVVRMTEEAILFQDRVTGIFEVNL